MRKTIYILFAILGMSLFAGCDDDKKDNNTPLAKQLVGEWRLTSWTGQAPQVFETVVLAGENVSSTLLPRTMRTSPRDANKSLPWQSNA